MRRFIEGRDREQATLFPERIDEAIEAYNPVRVVDAYDEYATRRNPNACGL
jgi:hypothetical protein